MTSDIYSHEINLTAATNHRYHNTPAVSEQLVSAYLYLLNLGTNNISDQRQVKYIQLSNFVAMMSLLASAFYIALAIVWGSALWFIVVNGLCITSAGVLCLNKMGHINLSRKLYLISVSPLLFAGALITGPQSGGEIFLVIAVLIPFLIYDLDDRAMIATGIITPVVFLFTYDRLEPYFLPYHLSGAHQATIHTLSHLMGVGLIIAAVSQFVYYVRRSESNLELANGRLSTQATELKRSNTDLEQFAYVISHDLKTPVRNISCFMKLLSKKHAASLDQEAQEFVDYALSGAKRMEQLIDDILAYSRIGRSLGHTAPVDINDLIQTISYELQDVLTERGASIIVRKEMPVLTNVHSSLVYHVFQHLIRNGLKFNTHLRPEIIISCDRTSQQFIFSVADNGIGIAEEYKEQVFKMFKRLHNENEYDGTGIGLAISKKIIELYEGDIWFESREGLGTTFYFTIPR